MSNKDKSGFITNGDLAQAAKTKRSAHGGNDAHLGMISACYLNWDGHPLADRETRPYPQRVRKRLRARRAVSPPDSVPRASTMRLVRDEETRANVMGDDQLARRVRAIGA